MQQSIQALNTKFTTQIAEVNNTIRQFAQVQSQAAEFSLQKLQEVIEMTAYNDGEDEAPLDQSLRNFSSFGIPNPVGAAQVPCKRLGMNGATKGRYFEFPPMQQGPDNVFYCDESFVQRVITKIEACVGVGIYSLRLQYHDGSQSPLFGHRAPNAENDIAIDQQTQQPAHIGAASIQAWGENYV